MYCEKFVSGTPYSPDWNIQRARRSCDVSAPWGRLGMGLATPGSQIGGSSGLGGRSSGGTGFSEGICDDGSGAGAI